MKISFLGTGLMGTPMIRNLAARGFDMHIWNRSQEKAQALSDIAHIYASPVEAVKETDFIISMLADGAVTTMVLKDQGVIKAAAENATFINMGSVEPECDINLAALANDEKKHFLDAPVSGGVKGAEDATLTIFVGGKADDVKRASAVLEVMGRVNHLGNIGAGQTAKLANQLIVAVTIGAVAEAFKLVRSAGYDVGAVHQALRGGFADSRILELHGARMVEGNYTPGGRSASQLKDIDNLLSQAQQKNLNLPLAQTVEKGFRSLVDEYDGGELDHSAYYLWLDYLNEDRT